MSSGILIKAPICILVSCESCEDVVEVYLDQDETPDLIEQEARIEAWEKHLWHEGRKCPDCYKHYGD